jgi:hypothetical protein
VPTFVRDRRAAIEAYCHVEVSCRIAISVAVGIDPASSDPANV